MKIVVRKSAVLGAGIGLVGCAALYLLVDRHIVNDDKALDVVTAAVLVLANAIGFRVAERFGVRLSGAAVAALGGMAVGSWVGFHTIGSFEQRVPIDSRPNGAPAIEGEEGADELKNPPREKVERTPVGGEAGVLIGWAGCFTLYLWLSRTTRSRRVRVAVGGLATVLVVGLLATVYVRQPATLRGHTDNVWCIAFSPDGTLMASGGWDNTVRLWNPTDRKLVATLTGHTGCVWAVAFSPDGKTLASVGYDKTVKLWDPRTGRETATLPDAPDNWRSLAFSPDGKRLAIPTGDGQVALWDLMAAQKTATVIGPPLVDWGGGAEAATFSPDGKTLAVGTRSAYLRDLGADPIANRKSVPRYHHGVIVLWDVATGVSTGTLLGHWDMTLAQAFSPDGKFLASGGIDGRGRVWDVSTGKELATLTGHKEWVRSVAWSPDGKLLLTGTRGQVKLWEMPSGKELATVAEDDYALGAYDCVAFSPDGRTLAWSDGRVIRLRPLSDALSRGK